MLGAEETGPHPLVLLHVFWDNGDLQGDVSSDKRNALGSLQSCSLGAEGILVRS